MGYVPQYNGYGYQVGFPFLFGAFFEFQKHILGLIRDPVSS